MKKIVKSIWEIRPGRDLLITASGCAAIMTILVFTCQVTVAGMIDLPKKLIEFCPFCMRSAIF